MVGLQLGLLRCLCAGLLTVGLLRAGMLMVERQTQTASCRRGVEQFGFPLTKENQKLFMRFSSRQSTQVFLFLILCALHCIVLYFAVV